MLALDSQYSNRKRRFSFAIDQATLVKPGSNHNVGLTWKSIISVHLTVKFLYSSDLIFNLGLGWLWSWKAGKGWEIWVWLYNSLHFKHPTISPLQAPRAKRLRKAGNQGGLWQKFLVQPRWPNASLPSSWPSWPQSVGMLTPGLTMNSTTVLFSRWFRTI